PRGTPLGTRDRDAGLEPARDPARGLPGHSPAVPGHRDGLVARAVAPPTPRGREGRLASAAGRERARGAAVARSRRRGPLGPHHAPTHPPYHRADDRVLSRDGEP